MTNHMEEAEAIYDKLSVLGYVDDYRPLPDHVMKADEQIIAAALSAAEQRGRDETEHRANVYQRALVCIAHTFTEDSHGNLKTLSASEYQKMAADAIRGAKP